MKLPPPPLVLERRVEFSQTDAAGILHFSTYYIFMEAAEAELFRQLGHPLLWREGDRAFGFPRVDSQCRFRRPLTFDSPVKIHLSIESILSGRIIYSFRFLNSENRLCAEGSMTTACAMRLPDGTMEAVPLPEKLKSALDGWKKLPL